MSNQPPPGSNPPGLPTTYTTTTGAPYPSQGAGEMLTTSYSPYPNPQPTDPYRTSPGVSSGPHPLPSMRTFDPVSQQRAIPHGGGQGMPFGGPQPIPPGTTHPMQMPPSEGFSPYYGPMMGINQPYGMSPEPMVNRYNIPPDARYVGHRPGPKKEIKRRTKTGCLTCRKRRIKCDESQPTCNNCKKSKRDCLGYDPMFRQASSPNQPSPSPQSTQGSTSTSTVPLGLSPSPSSSAQTAIQIPYGAASSALPGGYPPTSRHTPPSATSQLSQDGQFGTQQPPPSLRGPPGYEYYPHPPDQLFRGHPTSLSDESYPPHQRPSSEDSYPYRGEPPST